MKGEGHVYQCILAVCTENSIYEINEMLKNGIMHLVSESNVAMVLQTGAKKELYYIP